MSLCSWLRHCMKVSRAMPPEGFAWETVTNTRAWSTKKSQILWKWGVFCEMYVTECISAYICPNKRISLQPSAVFVPAFVCVRPAAACVILVNIKAALCFAELTNLSHPSPRAAFETHTASLGSALWTLNHFLLCAHPALPCIKLYSS